MEKGTNIQRNEMRRSGLRLQVGTDHNLIFLYNYVMQHIRSRDGAVGIATGYGLDDRGIGVRILVGIKVSRPDRFWGPPSLLSNDCPMTTGGFCPEVKRPGRKADHLPPTSAEVKNTCVYMPTSPYAFMVWGLVKYKVNYTFYLTPPYCLA
jgi:hypothetical protein